MEKNNNIICCLLNYKNDINANRLYSIFSKKYKTYLIDTFHKEDNSSYDGNIESDRLVLLDNVYWGGSQMKAYELLCKENGKYLLTIDTDIEIDDINAEKMLKALDIFNEVNNIGVYSGTLKLGSKALGATKVTIFNCHLFNQKTKQLRNIFRNEGWLSVYKKEVLDDIIPYLKLPDNKYGWGLCEALCRRAIKRGLRIVGDDRYEVFHPPGINYDNKEAQKEEIEFNKRFVELDCILDEEQNENFEKQEVKIEETKSKEKKIAIYTLFNDLYFDYGMTMLYSFLICNKWFKGDIFIFSDDENNVLSKSNLQTLRLLYSNIYIYNINKNDYQKIFLNFPKLNRKEFKASFYKLEMLKKDDYDYKLYLDADTCFNGSIEELFKNDNPFSYFMCRDIVDNKYKTNTVCIKTNDDYANMGFLLVNCNNISDNEYENIVKKCETIKEEDFKNKLSFKGLYGDQDCLNDILERVVLIPALTYDANVTSVTLDNINNTKIVHFYGIKRKPWDYIDLYFGFFIWYRWYFLCNRRINELKSIQ